MNAAPLTPRFTLAQELEVRALRARFVQLLAVTAIITLIVSTLILVISRGQNTNGLPARLFAVVVFVGLNALWYVLAQNRRSNEASVGLTLTFTSYFFLATLLTGVPVLLAGALAVISAAALNTRTLYLAVTGLVIGLYLVGLTNQFVADARVWQAGYFEVYVYPVLTLLAVAVATRYFINLAQQAASAARRNADLLAASSEISRIASQIEQMDALLSRTITLISNRFGYYHVQVFLLDEVRAQAILTASTGEPGRKLLARGYKLPVGSRSVIGQTTLRGESVVVSDTNRDDVFLRNELLPDTRSELALPLRSGDQIIGALDIQSTQPNDFLQQDAQALQVIADVLASEIRDIRILEAQARVAEENRQLYRNSEANLREIERLNRELTGRAWQRYAETPDVIAGVNVDGGRVITNPQWSDTLRRAEKERQPVMGKHDAEGHASTIAVPLMLRGEVIGAIEIERDSIEDGETLEVVQAVADRVAMSLENARLYENSLDAAAQELRINSIAARYQSAGSIDELLRITLSELSDALGAESGAIRLGRAIDAVVPSGTPPRLTKGEAAR